MLAWQHSPETGRSPVELTIPQSPAVSARLTTVPASHYFSASLPRLVFQNISGNIGPRILPSSQVGAQLRRLGKLLHCTKPPPLATDNIPERFPIWGS